MASVTLWRIIVMIAEVAPPNTVFITAIETARPSPGLAMANWDPPLKAKNPTYKINPPKAATYHQKNMY